MSPELTEWERRLLGGEQSKAGALAMRIVVAAAELLRAERLVAITSAHIDGCLHHGDGGVEFAETLVRGGGRVAVPTTLNVGALDLLHPGVVRAPPRRMAMARRQMEAYVTMGASPTFTCAPYQVGHEPSPGDQVAWGESNAIAFVNSVLGARTERYGDFLDACCALTGRAPLHGLHLEENRRAELIVDVTGVPSGLKSRDVFFPVLGTWLGAAVGRSIAAIVGLPSDTTRDQLKALGAAAASSGSVALFHVVGVTPEAPTLAAALGDRGSGRGSDPGLARDLNRDLARDLEDAPPAADALGRGGADRDAREASAASHAIVLEATMLRATLDRLSTALEVGPLDAVAVGSPHFSLSEFAALARLLSGRRCTIPFYACTARDTLASLEVDGTADTLRSAGIEIVADTCIVVTPILPAGDGVLMTNSGKFAHYGPSNTGYEVVYGSLEDCVDSAVAGRVCRNEELWSW